MSTLKVRYPGIEFEIKDVCGIHATTTYEGFCGVVTKDMEMFNFKFTIEGNERSFKNLKALACETGVVLIDYLNLTFHVQTVFVYDIVSDFIEVQAVQLNRIINEPSPEIFKTDTPLTVTLDNEEIVRTNL